MRHQAQAPAMKTKIKRGDTVVLITGKDKGRVGQVLSVDPVAQRVRVEGMNLLSHYTKGNPQAGTRSAIIKKEGGVHISNVALYNPTSKRADKASCRLLEDGQKVRVYRSTGERVDNE